MILKIILLLFTLDQTLAGSSDPSLCCSGENVLLEKFCSTKERVPLNCTAKYILNPEIDEEESFHINDQGKLVYPSILTNNDIIVPKHEYCLTRLNSENGTKVAIVCYFAENHVEGNKLYGLRAICGFLSVGFLVLTLIVYYLVPELRDLQGKCIIHALVALAISFTILGFMQLIQLDEIGCKIISHCSYLAFMTTFFWLNVTSFHVWKTVVAPNISGTEKQWYRIYILYGHGMPLLFLSFLIIAHHAPGDHLRPGIGSGRCWFNTWNSTWAYFYGPISILLCMNLILFIWSGVELWKSNSTSTHVISLKYKVSLYLRLFLIMGLLWFFEILSAALENVHEVLDYFWMITDYINVFQGALIFLLLVVFRKRALRGLSNKGCCFIQFPGMWKTLEDQEAIHENEAETHLSNVQTT